MKKIIILVLLMLSLVTFVPISHSEDMIKVTGEIVYGSLDSGIKDSNGDVYGWITGSNIDRKIFKTCKVGYLCRIVGTVDKVGMFTKIISVERLGDMR